MSEAMHYLEDMIQNEPGAFRRPTRAEAQPLSLQEKRHRRSRLRQRLKEDAGGLREFWELAALNGLPRPTDNTEPEAKAAWIRGKTAHLALNGAQIEVAEIASAAFADGVDEVEELTGQPVGAWDSRCEVARQALASADYPSEGSFALQFDQILHQFTGESCFPDQSYDHGVFFDEEGDVPQPEGPLPPLVNPVLGRKLLEEDRGAGEPSEGEPKKRFFTWAELQGMETVPRAGVMAPYLMKGQVTMLVAAPGCGKSLECAATAVALAAGLPWDGRCPPEPMPVIIVNNEDDLPENRRRLKAAAEAQGVDLNSAMPIHVADASVPFVLARRGATGVEAGEDLKVLERQIESTGAGLVIIDPAIEVMRVSENDNVEMKDAFGLLRDLARKHNCAILVVHHSGKEGARGLNAARGASSVAGLVRGYRNMTEVDEKEMASRGIPQELAGDLVRVDDVKLSYGRKRKAPSYFLRASYEVDGEEVAALVPWLPEEPAN